MKKLTILLAALALCFSVSAKTWTNYTGFGWRIPTSTTVKSDDSSMDFDIKFKNQTGLSLDYTGAHESGFSMRAILDINYSKSNLKAGDDDDDLEGLNGLFLIGAGYAPVLHRQIIPWNLWCSWSRFNSALPRQNSVYKLSKI